MIEHVTIHVEDLDTARAFYEPLLAPLGYDVTRRLPDHDDAPRIAFGRDRRAQLWLVEDGIAHEGVVIAVSADDETAVDAFRAAAEEAGADEVSEAEAGPDGRYAASAKDGSGNRLVAVAGGSGRGMIDHVQLVVSDFGRTLRFYEKLLEPLEVEIVARELDHPDGPRVAFGQGGEPGLWLTEEGDPQSDVAIGFSAAKRRQVDEFHVNAKDAGGRKIQAADVRGEVGPEYYVAGACDPDNNRIEAVHDGEHGLAPAAALKSAGGDRLADAAALQRWEAERAQAKAAEMAEAEKRSGRGVAALSTAPLAFIDKPKPEKGLEPAADEEDAEDEAFDFASLGLDSEEEAASEDAASEEGESEEIDWAALGLDDEASSETSEASESDEIDWAALGLDDDSATDNETGGDSGEIDWAALGLEDEDEAASGEAEDAPEKAAKPVKKEISKAAMGLDLGGKF